MSAIVEFASAGLAIAARNILQDFCLQVQAGETLVLLGRSGSGKTTALKLINGLLAPTSGQVLVEGRPTAEWDAVQLKRRIGYVIQEAGLFPHFTVAANIGLVPKLENWPAAKIDARVHELLEQMGLPARDFANRYPRQLSGGQRQRVGVARALAADPPLLLLDEPFGALDPVTRLDLQRQFLKLRDTLRKTAVFVTHDVREALMLGTRVALLREGRLEVLESPKEFLCSANPEARAFLECLDWKPE
ncbi:MAG: ATP-binding cassette domain-containing protein [Acidobacteriota bacterium]|nr:ATP-binding cassette domain-containing protein [Acidobacteriota bacterium]